MDLFLSEFWDINSRIADIEWHQKPGRRSALGSRIFVLWRKQAVVCGSLVETCSGLAPTMVLPRLHCASAPPPLGLRAASAAPPLAFAAPPLRLRCVLLGLRSASTSVPIQLRSGSGPAPVRLRSGCVAVHLYYVDWVHSAGSLADSVPRDVILRS